MRAKERTKVQRYKGTKGKGEIGKRGNRENVKISAETSLSAIAKQGIPIAKQQKSITKQ